MRVPLLVVSSVLFAACATSASVGVTASETPTVDGVAVESSGSPAEARTPTEASEDPGLEASEAPTSRPQPAGGLALPFSVPDAKALITTTGVPVAVLTGLPEGLVVRTPCGRTATIPPTGVQLEDVSVVLDPGHGGPIDTGAVGPNGLIENGVNLRVARVTESLLKDAGVSVVLTRTADYATTLAVRSALADHLGAEVMVSIHHNAPTFESSPTPGTEVFVQDGSEHSRRLGGLVYAELVDALSVFGDIGWSAARDAGVMAVLNDDGIDAYGMIRRPETVTVLAELAYVSNAPEAELMARDAYIAVAAQALADAIQAYLSAPDAQGRGFQPHRVFNPDAAPGADVCVDPALE